MEVVAAILGSAVMEAGRSLCGSFPSIKNFISFQSNLTTLEKEKKSLVDQKDKVIEDVDYSSDAQMTQWLREVEQFLHDVVNSVPTGITANNGKLCGCFFNFSERYRLSKETAIRLKEIERLLKVGDIAVKMAGQNYLTKAVEHIPGPSIVNQTTASQNLAKVMDLLNDDDVLRIGVWGMGGVGKTTLVKNLNNQLKGSSSTHQFGVVIWATVSKNLDLKKVQIQLAERLNFKASMEESVQRLAIQLHQRLQKEKFLLILDDVWEPIDLDSLGVPQTEDHTGSKIILTSRSLEVCREMKTDKEVKVDVLNDEESWQLFTENAGKVATSEHIEPIARYVARECSGLPLAITIVGSVMRGKTMVELWTDALSGLRRSVPNIKGIENKVYNPLKWSYDSLQGKNIKPCFLYCCLYPEDFSIGVSELVNCWLGEGLIDQQQNYEDSYNRGIALIENLKDCCLLEHGAHEVTVKMHDVVHDVAIWISSTMEDECKSIVRSGIGLTRISEVEMSESLKRVSFMNNRITKLPNCGICCPETVSLLLQGNRFLSQIPNGFLQAFESLKVLNLSETRIRLLPQSMLELGDLRILLLKKCFYLEELPQLGGLSKLQVLDCSETSIRELPSGMKSLINLRQLYLSGTYNLKTIQSGIVSGLSGLEVLDMTSGAYIWGLMEEANDRQATFEELQNLEQLHSLSIRLGRIQSLQNEDLTLIGRLRIFKLLIGPETNSFRSKHDKRKLIISGLQLSGEWIGRLLTNASMMHLNNCPGLNQMLETLVIRSIGSYTCLKSLTITRSSSSLRPDGGCTALDLLPNLEELRLHDLTKLGSISELVGLLGLRFSRLKLLEVFRCEGLEYLLTCGNFIISLPNLETIKVSSCESFVEIFNFPLQENFVPEPVVPNLRTLKLVKLPRLETLSRQDGSGQHSKFISCVYHMKAIEQVEVFKCDNLRKLPLTIQNANTMKEIRGEAEWWNQLELEAPHNTKSSLDRFFNGE
ncbi:hypothetical protein Ddye_027266 [Dipteronia dyeriana]|uniref:AAA+ ATPase domain-containing protein n=1 Tax=Dipteronia dyeriana TaxID=168575 RepID=A0AAD9TPF1_9ROSI|nr:hypothetical protein Ddye_027266 [Dipteronia dyeriana]